jgi:hypothetical protein
MRPMETAPRDGTRVLIKNALQYYNDRTHKFEHVGSAWIECWFNKGYWHRWCGSITRWTTDPITPLGWAPLPGEED